MSIKTICFQTRKKYHQWRQLLANFWNHFPALYFGFFFLIGITAASMPLALFGWLLFKAPKKWLGALVITSLGYVYFSWLYCSLPLDKEVTGQALVHIHHVKRYSSSFKTSLVYEVTLKHFSAKNLTLRHLPCRLYAHKNTSRPLAHRGLPSFPRNSCSNSASLLHFKA